jgi:hypothetical protein
VTATTSCPGTARTDHEVVRGVGIHRDRNLGLLVGRDDDIVIAGNLDQPACAAARLLKRAQHRVEVAADGVSGDVEGGVGRQFEPDGLAGSLPILAVGESRVGALGLGAVGILLFVVGLGEEVADPRRLAELM